MIAMTLKSSKYALVLGAFCAASAIAQTPAPQPPTERTGSPYDRNPACRDRDVAGTDPACVIQDGPQIIKQFGSNTAKPQPELPAQSAAPTNVNPTEGNRTPTEGNRTPTEGNRTPTEGNQTPVQRSGTPAATASPQAGGTATSRSGSR